MNVGQLKKIIENEPNEKRLFISVFGSGISKLESIKKIKKGKTVNITNVSSVGFNEDSLVLTDKKEE